MFEKEAKKYQEEVITKKDYPHSIAVDWQRGAEFGFQKGIKTKINTTTISDCPIKDEWHDLRKNPTDLPKDYGSVWTNKGAACHDNDGWFDDYGCVNGVIAWCEPKFEEVAE